ncbi:MAG: hypothetical protein ABUS54_14670 [Actinomycetota bacterium]
MKRFAPLLLVVFALAVPVAAFADDSTPPPATTTTTTTATQQGHPIAKLRLEILGLRLQLVRLRYRVACHDKTSSACTQLTQKLVDRLTTADKNVQAKLTQLGCTSTSTDKKCTALAKVDAKLQKVIANLGSPAPAPSSDESSLDAAAGALGGLNG